MAIFYGELVSELTFLQKESREGVPAKALDRSVNDGKWKLCHMVDYDPSTENWKIIWDDKKTEEWIPRLYLLFLTEDPRNHAKRIKAAFEERKQAESKMVFSASIQFTIKVPGIICGKYAG